MAGKNTKKIKGSNADDAILGTPETEEIDAGPGDDSVHASDGDDQIKGGNGDDILHGEDGSDEISGQSGNDSLFGGAGDDSLSGGNDDDSLVGGEGNDQLSGEAGSDVLEGGAGDDSVYGDNAPGSSQAATPGSGQAQFNDRLDGGSGNDLVFGQHGDDIGVWTLSENFGGSDSYDGGAGDDSILFRFTYGQAASAEVLSSLTAFDAFLADHANSRKDNGPTFAFDAFAEIDLTDWEGYSIELVNTAPTAHDDQGSTDEDTLLITDVSSGLLANDTDPDHLDVLTVLNFDASSVRGATVTVNADGSYSYDSSAASELQALAVGEHLVDSFNYTIADLAGETSDASTTITVTGVNDAPEFSVDPGDSDAEDIDESDSGLSTSGTLTVKDVDLSDTVSASILSVSAGGTITAAPANADLLAMLSVSQDVIAAGDNSGSLIWSFDSDGEAFDYLAAGEDLELAFSVQAEDIHGATDTHDVTVTIKGTNDVPSITGGDDSGLVVEPVPDSVGRVAPVIIDQGALDFTDVDLSDTHSAVYQGGSENLGSMVGTVLNEDDDNGAVSWVYRVDTADTEYLAAGQTHTDTFTVILDDGNGGTDSHEVSVNVRGTNDAPKFNVGDINGAVTEMLIPTGNLGDNGILEFSDVDLLDSHSIHQVRALAPTRGSLTAGIATDTTEGTGGEVSWTYNVAASRLENLAEGEQVIERFEITLTDGKGGFDTQRVDVVLTGTNDAPTIIGGAFTGEVTEMLFPQGSLVDVGRIRFRDTDLLDNHSVTAIGSSPDILGALSTSIVPGLGGQPEIQWNYSVDAALVEYLEEGETRDEVFTVTLEDPHGGEVTANVGVTIVGTAEAPSLTVITGAGDAVNEVRITATVDAEGFEQVDLSFADLPAGAVILDENRNNVSTVISAFSGTAVFIVVLPENSSTNADISVNATGFTPGGEGGTSTELVDLSFNVSSLNEQVDFSSINQSMWAPGSGVLGWHKYVPIVGDVAQIYNEATELWEDDPNAELWSSGRFDLISAGINSQEIIAELRKGPDAVFAAAQAVFDDADAAFDQAKADVAADKAQADADLASAFATAQSAFDDAKAFANQVFTNAVAAAQRIFDTTVAAGEGAAQAVLDLAQQAYDSAVSAANAALDVARGIRDAAHVADFLNVLTSQIDAAYQVAVDIKNAAVSAAQTAFDSAKEIFDGGVDAAVSAAESVYDAAVSAATTVKNAAIATAQTALDAAEAVAETAKDGAYALANEALNLAQSAFTSAQGVFQTAENAFNDVLDTINQVLFSAELDAEAELSAEVGLKVDFELDLGSVDSQVSYDLNSQQQYNATTDMLSLTPQLANLTNGEDIAFSTLSPNVTFATSLVYDVGLDLDVFADTFLKIGDETIFDISGTAEGIEISSSIGTGAGEFAIVDLDTKDLVKPFNVPGIEAATQGIMSIALNLPNIATDGTAAAYDPAFFEEGGLVALDLSEITDSVMNLVNAKIDFSPQLLAEFPELESLQQQPNFSAVVDEVGEALLSTLFGALDGQSKEIPIFLIDATDETSSSLLHFNFIPDSKIGDTLTSDTGSLGFYTAYGESKNIAEVTIDVDQLVAVILNKVAETVLAAVTLGATAPITTLLDDINPLDIKFGLDLVLEMLEVPESTRTKITDIIDFTVGFETADIDVSNGYRFSQEFSLSVDDMSFLVTMEDGTDYLFAANTEGSLLIENASQHDANGDGNVDYNMELVPTAMFSNDTEINLGLGYVLDFLTANFKANLTLPIGELLSQADLPAIPGLSSLNVPLINVALGPLLRVKGDLDLVSADIFESRFELDLGSDDVDGSLSIIDDEIVGTSGDDVLEGRQGNDIIFSNGGNDLIVFGNSSGSDVVNDFASGDVIDLQAVDNITSFADLQNNFVNDGNGNTQIDLGDGNSILLVGVDSSSLQAGDFLTA